MRMVFIILFFLLQHQFYSMLTDDVDDDDDEDEVDTDAKTQLFKYVYIINLKCGLKGS